VTNYLAAKIGLRVKSSEECNEALAVFAGQAVSSIEVALEKLVKEYGVVEWNEQTRQYEIIGDALPRRAFLDYLQSKVQSVGSENRAQLFAQNFKQWLGLETLDTDFGANNNISTTEWRYTIIYSNVSLLDSHIDYAFRTWYDAIGVDENRGNLIYCYVGPESDLENVHTNAQLAIDKAVQNIGITKEAGAPIAIIFINDKDGLLGERIAEFWVLNNEMGEEDAKKFSNFMLDRENTSLDEMRNRFRLLERERNLILACKKDISEGRIKNILAELFDVIYYKHIPFPFDGFHTAKGNAAKDCRLFTAELFMGNLNQGRVAAMKTQQKNRAVRVFSESWQAFEKDGSICRKPRNKGVGNIVDWLDSEINTTDILNLGSIVRQLCRPPYGCNIASAGLLIGIFIAARKNNLTFIRGSSQPDVENWLGDTLEGNFFNIALLDETDIRLVSKEEIDEWEKLLNAWDFEETYIGRGEYLEKAYKLRENIKIPPSNIYRFELLEQRSKDALLEFVQWKKTIDDQYEHMVRAYKKGHAGNLSRCGAELVKLREKMESNAGAWTKEQFEETNKFIDHARQAIKQFFPEWLPAQVVIDAKALGKFQHDMLRLNGGNLGKLELLEEKNHLEKHVAKVSSEVDRRARVKVVVDQVNMFVGSHSVSSVTKVKELYSYLNSIKEFAKDLNSAKSHGNIPQIKKAEERLNDLKKTCQNQLNAHQERAGAIWETEITSLYDIQQTAQEIRTIMTIYDGKDQDLEDFKLMQHLLTFFEHHYHQLASLDLTNKELEANCKRFMKETESMLDESDEIPWDISETYERLKNSIYEQRNNQAKEWFDRYFISSDRIFQLDAGQANKLRQVLQSPPAYISEGDRKQIDAALKACNKRLDELEVEGLIARFQGLSKEAKTIFLERAQEMF